MRKPKKHWLTGGEVTMKSEYALRECREEPFLPHSNWKVVYPGEPPILRDQTSLYDIIRRGMALGYDQVTFDVWEKIIKMEVAENAENHSGAHCSGGVSESSVRIRNHRRPGRVAGRG